MAKLSIVRRGWYLAAALLLLSCRPQPPECGPASNADTPAAPQQPTGKYGEVDGVDMIGGDGVRAFALSGETSRVELSHIAVEGQPFDEAVRAEIKEQSTNPWDVQISTKNAAPVERGDVLLATFYFRTEHSRDESGEGKTEFVFELARDPWTKSVSYPVRASRDWKQLHVPFVAKESYAPGEAQMIFRMGYPPQTIDIGGVTVENFGKQLALADLPVTKLTYRGREPDAAWRQAAAERIDKYRKAELTVTVRDAKGKPVPDADVHAALTRHEFEFGTCVAAARIVSQSDEKYRQVTREMFNTATIENNLKWVPLAGDWGGAFTLDRAQKAVDWLRAQGFRVRGHVLVWPGWHNLPKSLKAKEKQPEQLRAEVEKHIRELATAMRGKLTYWDVMNEPFDNHDLMDILGRDVMVDWFKIARKADPAPTLFINDYAILSGGGGSTPHRDHYEETIRFLIDQGAPLQGIGLQGHFGTSLTAPEDLWALLERYAKFQKILHVTEYDIVVDDEQLAADYTRDFYTIAFSHPAVKNITMWGFWDTAHWKQSATLYRANWTLKPSGEVYRKLVQETWHTDATGKTDAQGAYRARGFLGSYRITVKVGAQQQTVTGKVESGGSQVTVTVK